MGEKRNKYEFQSNSLINELSLTQRTKKKFTIVILILIVLEEILTHFSLLFEQKFLGINIFILEKIMFLIILLLDVCSILCILILSGTFHPTYFILDEYFFFVTFLP